MKTIVHVNQHIVKANKKHGSFIPALTVKNYKETKYAREVTIHGASKVIHSDKPLACGARCWIETNAKVTTFLCSHKEVMPKE